MLPIWFVRRHEQIGQFKSSNQKKHPRGAGIVFSFWKKSCCGLARIRYNRKIRLCLQILTITFKQLLHRQYTSFHSVDESETGLMSDTWSVWHGLVRYMKCWTREVSDTWSAFDVWDVWHVKYWTREVTDTVKFRTWNVRCRNGLIGKSSSNIF